MKWLMKYILLIVGLASGVAYGQTKVEVITKTITDQFIYNPGYGLKVEGKAATIRLRSWDEKRIKITMKLISKGLTKEVAEKELSYHQYAIGENNRQYVVRNYLLLPGDVEKLSTIQEAIIEVMVPRSINLEIENSLGTIGITDINGFIEIDNEYGDVTITSCSGKISLTNTFGELKLDGFVGTLSADLSHTASQVMNFAGSAVMKTNLGDVEWRESGKIEKVRIELLRSDLSLKGLSFDEFYWQLKTRYGEIVTPRDLAGNKINYGNNDFPTIEVSSDFGKIMIEE